MEAARWDRRGPYDGAEAEAEAEQANTEMEHKIERELERIGAPVEAPLTNDPFLWENCLLRLITMYKELEKEEQDCKSLLQESFSLAPPASELTAEELMRKNELDKQQLMFCKQENKHLKRDIFRLGKRRRKLEAALNAEHRKVPNAPHSLPELLAFMRELQRALHGAPSLRSCFGDFSGRPE
ncbi:hypothetical protein QOT17_006946 [Balamuthia mandrillaris]